MTDHLSDNRAATKPAGPSWNEFRLRFLSAIVLAGFGTAATLAGTWYLAVVVAGVSIILAWEWGRLVRSQGYDATLVLHGVAVSAAVLLMAGGFALYALVALAIGVVAIAVLRMDELFKLSAFGVVYIGLPAVGLIWLRGDAGGWIAVLVIFGCVWAHDTAAMLVGRAVGGPRLWPSVSPNKTWSGAVAGWVASTLAAIMATFFLNEVNGIWLACFGFLLGIAALFGDLAESNLKRIVRVKNTSGLIPGHGGFLDRLDGAVACFVVACVIALWIDADQPVRALLLGP